MINDSTNLKIKSGATVRVFEKVKEGDKERLRRFEGMVLARKHGNEIGATFTVRGTVAGVGVEKVFPIHSQNIDKVEVLSSPKKVSRSKLYYVRDISRKMIRKKTLVKDDISQVGVERIVKKTKKKAAKTEEAKKED
ncbi:MAG: 50S ribosomal protein L19 [Candidatus Harrisonbacteria bacterium CG10_big_fil_rev_8_21_14_0_10_45_28]|uniref:50S ribosomal protein L19 n=1 Tax=Candidatus Harrisonbacteria bacterium CG10_big_fil_rev_8_21_14_0_10_45_28 TaxID=1974586 RepID=A0A2H0UNG2_9BACT|nr:MAG: 50S ribosomal protein L19 [Candidatus Harrisonbacteria bacterium CG10_big_fil_rev_8_21_14_0_10_45_28]